MTFTPTDSVFSYPTLPAWVTSFRPHQVDAIEQILTHFKSGVRVVLLDAPTGAGKSLIAEATRQLLIEQGRGNRCRRCWRELHDPKSIERGVGPECWSYGFRSDSSAEVTLKHHTLYTCTTKSLQDQFCRDFLYAAILKGRSNYPTLDFPERFTDRFASLTAADCTKSRTIVPACSGCDEEEMSTTPVLHCSSCHPWPMCPYERAKAKALSSFLAVTNTAYFLTEANGPGRFSERDLVIADEADLLENALMSQVEVTIPPRMMRRVGLDLPSRKTVEDAWTTWLLDKALPKVQQTVEEIRPREGETPTPEQVKEVLAFDQLLGRLSRLALDLRPPDPAQPTQPAQPRTSWVYDSKAHDRGAVSFKPVRVDAIAEKMLWRHGRQWLVMSATLIDPTSFAESLGLPDSDWAKVNVPSTFPAKNRPMHVVPGPSMAKKEQPTSIPIMVDLVGQVLDKHPNERILVHTVSYDLAGVLFEELRRQPQHRHRLVVYSGALEREMALEQYLGMPNSVILAPSLERGIDLPGDKCTVQVVTKVPFPYLGDPQVSQRLRARGGQLWYDVQAIRSLVQMTGRGVRSDSDTCRTYLLDGDFMRKIYKKNKRLFPKWWQEGLRWEGRVLKVPSV